MPEFLLSRKTAFNLDAPVAGQWEGFGLAERPDERVWWLSTPRDAGEAFAAAMRNAFGFEPPPAGRFVDDGEGAVRLAFAGERQWFLFGAPAELPKNLDAASCATDQSDGWVGLTLEGAMAREVLCRLCPLDLHPDAFPAGSAARSPFEGMLALIACEDVSAGRYAVHFQRSSARSFLDHVRHAASSVCGAPESGPAH